MSVAESERKRRRNPPLFYFRKHRMAKSIFDIPEFKPHARRWQERSALCARRQSYYDGSIYRPAMQDLGWLAPRVYGHIKPLFLPLARAVDVDAGIVPGGWQWQKDTPDPVRLARETVFDWSDWDTDGVLFVHYGAVFGMSGLKVVDLREEGRVLIVPVSPEMYMLVESGQYDSTPRLALWLESREDGDGEIVEYAEVIEADRVRTFADGEPLGVDGREPEYRNELGFVPFVECYHMRTGHKRGEPTFEKAIPLLDEVNGLASYLSEIIKKHAEPQWAIFGAEPSELTHSGDNVWFIPGPGDAKILVPDIDIEGVLKFVQVISSNVTQALPELAFDELRNKAQIATATVELELIELALKIKRIRPNYDSALISALQMAGRAARSMGLTALAVLDDPGLAFANERSVLPVNRLDAIRLEEAELMLLAQREIYEGGGLTETATAGDGLAQRRGDAEEEQPRA